MDTPMDDDMMREVAECLGNNDAPTAVSKIQKYLEDLDKIPLNMAITGESGSGKSTFVNVFRGIDNKDEGAAPTGCVETTIESKEYPHPNYPNVKLWDLPGIGTTNFPANQYLRHVGFEKFDFFIIVSADRFRENDAKLAQEIKKMGKKFYFVRSKIDNNLRDEERSQRDFNAERTLQKMRENCISGLVNQGVESPQVFLISNFDLHLYDFRKLQETMERDLPSHKRNALLFSLPSVSLGIISKKKDAFHSKIKYQALLSAAVAAAPAPGLSFAVDVGILVGVIRGYKLGFGLDHQSLEKLAQSAKMSLGDLQAVIKSDLASNEISKELVIKLLSMSASGAALMAVEEGARFIPIFGIAVAMGISFLSTYRYLSSALDMLAKDAQNVLKKALAQDTSL